MSGNDVRPIIIKKVKKVSGGGHHGGAWKVAYADFVTAMMAFFMLMWLLNATTEKQRKGIADYFNPTIPINRVSGGGDGAFGGDSIMSEETLAYNGSGASQRHPTEADAARGDLGEDSNVSPDHGAGQAEREAFEELEKALSARSGESMVSSQAARHIVTRLTDEGLIVEIFDLPDAPLFVGETDEPTFLMSQIIEMIVPIFAVTANDLAINGYTRSQPKVVAVDRTWDLSGDRASAIRVLLEESAFDADRIQRVTGFADRLPADNNLLAVRNNRVELILLRGDF